MVTPYGPRGGGLTGIATLASYPGASAAVLHACDVNPITDADPTSGALWLSNNLSVALGRSTSIKNEGVASATFSVKVNADDSKAYIDLGALNVDKAPFRYALVDMYVDSSNISGIKTPWALPFEDGVNIQQTHCYLECAANATLITPHTSLQIPDIPWRTWVTIPLKLEDNEQVRTIGIRSGGTGTTGDKYDFYIDHIRLRAYTPLEEAMEAGKSVILAASYSPSQTQGVLLT